MLSALILSINWHEQRIGREESLEVFGTIDSNFKSTRLPAIPATAVDGNSLDEQSLKKGMHVCVKGRIENIQFLEHVGATFDFCPPRSVEATRRNLIRAHIACVHFEFSSAIHDGSAFGAVEGTIVRERDDDGFWHVYAEKYFIQLPSEERH